jgi:hypothetical protein
MSDHPYTREAIERWQQGKTNIFDSMAALEDERDEARMEMAKWAGIMHDPNKPLKLEPLIWKSNGGGNSVPETWRDAYEDLQKEYEKATGYWASLQNWLDMVHESYEGQDRDGLCQLYVRGPFAGWSQEKMVRLADELWDNSQHCPFDPKEVAHL